MERYSEGVAGPRANKEPNFKFEQPDFSGVKTSRLIDNVMDRVDKLDANHIAVQYCEQRKIPKEKWDRLYHIEDISKIHQLAPKYKDRIKTTEPRLAIPFFDREGKMTAISLRDYGNNPLKYILVKMNENSSTIYGLDVINYNKPVKIVEGPLDSLFLDNAIACAGTSFNKIESLNLPEDRVIIVDNQPKNKEVCNIIHNLIKAGEKVVIWPEDIEQKDINDMILADVDVENLISNNVFHKLEAELRFTNWRKC